MNKWPISMLLVRHDVSAYNNMKLEKEQDPLYINFVRKYSLHKNRIMSDGFPHKAPKSLLKEAKTLMKKYRLGCSDPNTPIIKELSKLSIATGAGLKEQNELPDIIYLSPHLRTRQTFEGLKKGWPELAGVRVIEEELITEKDHGLQAAYNDRMFYFLLNPQQLLHFEQSGSYHYRYLNGENTPDVRRRARLWISTLIREFSGKKVLAITHHLTILSIKAQLLRWGEEEFIAADKTNRPLNCSVSKFIAHKDLGNNGRFAEEYYNKVFHSEKL